MGFLPAGLARIVFLALIVFCVGLAGAHDSLTPTGIAAGPRAGIGGSLDAGGQFNCVIQPNGAIDCWGRDQSGMLSPPAAVYAGIGTGQFASCAVKGDGALACWGWDANNDGLLTSVPAGTHVQVTGGYRHFCALDTAGAAHCWGDDTYGQLTPPASTVFTQIDAGTFHTCGIKADGSVACWGQDTYAQSTPNAGTFRQVSSGNRHTCGIKTNGSLACWGSNAYGQSTPPAGDFIQIAAGDNHACGIKSDGSLACWGLDTSNQLTNMPTTGRYVQVASGFVHSCAMKDDGSVVCWGHDGYNQVGGTPAGNYRRLAPSAGEAHTCTIRSDGTLACWGSNGGGRATPPAGTFTQVSAGLDHTCGIKGDGNVACWGYDGGSHETTPPAGQFAQISSGGNYSCGVKADSSLVCWGGNTTSTGADGYIQANAGKFTGCGVGVAGNLGCWGDNSWHQAEAPATGTYLQAVGGYYHSCALKTDRTVTCWGNNQYGQASSPAGTFRQISAGSAHSCGIKTDGTVACWGDSSAFLTGDPGDTFVTLTTGMNWTCGVTTGGVLKCGGNTFYGQSPQSFSPATLPNPSQLAAYSQTLSYGPGYAPPSPSYTVTSGGLPPGLALAQATGVLSGTATTPGVYNFTVSFSDANGFADSQDYSVTVDPVLTISPTPAHGTVTSAGSLNCGTGGAVCDESYANGAAVQLTASPDTGYHFDGWSGGCSASFAIAGDMTCGAAFALNAYAIAVNAGAGGTADCTPNPVNHGDSTTCTATPGIGYSFTGWSGDCSGMTCVVANVTGPRTVAAGFSLNSYAVTANAGTGGTASCTPNPVNHGDGTTCTATPDAGYTFTGWSGDCSGMTCVLANVTGARSVAAAFTLNTYAIAVDAGTGGTAACSPNPVSHGDTATCTATPDAGYRLTGWSGDCSGPTCILGNVTGSRSVAAGFAPIIGVSGPAATGSGTIAAMVAGGGATCRFVGHQFLPLAAVPVAAPVGTGFPHGLFEFTLDGCAAGGTVTLTVNYPQALPAGTQYWKYGPTPDDASLHWYVMPAAIAGNTATFSITDGGLGDDDLTVNGTIVDQGGPGVEAQTVPILSSRGLAVTATLLMLAGLLTIRRGRTA